MGDSKKYGLIIKKLKPAAQQVKKASIFGNESSSDEDLEETAHKAVNMSLMKEAEKKKQMKQTQIEIRKALEEDPTVYEYDNVYDDIAEKKAAHAKVPEKDKKPKYIEGLLKSAAARKREFERQVERQVQKEREKEGDEFGDKDAFVTEAYKEKMLEQAEEEERLKKQEALDAANDVTKQSDLSMFYRNLLNKNVSTGGEYSAENTKADSKAKEADKKDEKPDRNEKYREPRGGHRHSYHDDRENTRRSDKDHDKHGSRKRESVKESKNHRETVGESGRQSKRHEEHDEERHCQDTPGDGQDRDHDKHGSRKGEAVQENKNHRETVGESGRQSKGHEESDEERHRRRSSEHSERHRQDTPGDRQDRDHDKHGSRKGEAVQENKNHRETVGESGRQSKGHEESDEERHCRSSSEHSERHRQDTPGDGQDRDEERVHDVEKQDKHQHKDEDRGAKEKDSDTERGSNKIHKGHKAQTDSTETQAKFAKRSTQETVMSARERYLARKQSRETARAAHGNADTEED